MSIRAPYPHRLGDPDADGPLLVLVHGMEDRWRSWEPLARLLDPSWRIVALDVPWHTGSDYAWNRHGRAAAWIGAALDHLDETPDVLVGHSLGATALLDVLATRAPAPTAAVLLAPYFCPPGLRITWETFEESRRHFTQIVGEGLPVHLGERAASVGDDIRRAMTGVIVDRIGPLGFTSLFEEFAASATLPLSSVRVPTLVLGAGSDPGLADGRAAALAEAMPSAEVVLRDDYGHFCHIEQAEDVARRLTGFVTTHVRAARRAGQEASIPA